MIIIEQKSFQDSKELRQYINQAIRNQYQNNAIIHQEHQTFIKALLHFQYSEEFINAIDSIIIKYQNIYGKLRKVFFAKTNFCNTDLKLGISECVSSADLAFKESEEVYQSNLEVKTLCRQKQNALRATIYPQIVAFKEKIQQENPHFNFANHQVDHVAPSFQTIILNWMKQKGIDWKDLEVGYDANDYPYLKNKALADDFYEYHKKVAVLDYIPEEENRQKK